MTILLFIVSLEGVLSTLPFLIPYHILLTAQCKRLGYKLPLQHIVIAYIFVYYLACVLIMTQISSIRDIFHNSFGIPYPELLNTPPEFNLIPFRWISEGVRPYIENTVLFMPLGLMLPFIWKKYEVLWRTALTGITFSFIIELSQLFNGRVPDIDDLLMNTLGACIGWLIFRLLKGHLSKFQSKFSVRDINSEKIPLLLRAEACFYMIGAFAGIMVFFPFLRA